jgi:activator of HSP90 ATPase
MQPMNEKMTRRGMSLILSSLTVASAHAQTNKPGTAIHLEVDFKSAPARVYEALLDAKQFTAFTKDTAEIQPQPGAAFKLFGGRIEGRNVELVANRRIVQAWRSSSWPPGVYSIVRFELVAHGSGTRIVFDHTGFTEDHWESLNEGWKSNYWEPLRKYLNA